MAPIPATAAALLPLVGLLVHASGTVAAWGWNDNGQANVPAQVTNAVGVAGGYEHSLALLADGSVTAWGHNSYGQIAVPAHVTNAVDVAGGSAHSLALELLGDPLDPDIDDDGLLDGDEVNIHGTDPLNADSDGDGLPDGAEISTYGTDPLDADSDDDDLDDGLEVSMGLNPLSNDSDGNGTPDADEDTDGDGIPNGVELANGLDPACVSSCPTGALHMKDEEESNKEKRQAAVQRLAEAQEAGSQEAAVLQG